MKSKFLDWQYMSGPVAFTVAVALAGMIGFFLSHTPNVWEIRASWTIVAVGVVMDMKQTEQMLVASTIQAAGTIFGAIIGLGIGAVHTTLLPVDPLTARIFLGVALALACFIGAIMMKFAGKNANFFQLSAITAVGVAYSGTIFTSVGRFISLFSGIVIAMCCVYVFSHEDTHHTALRFAEKSVQSCLRLAVLAFSDSEGTEEPSELFDSVRMAISSEEDTLEARKKWRGWMRLKAEPEMERLSESVITLYHRCHNCFITAKAVEFVSLSSDPDISAHFQVLILEWLELIKRLTEEVPNLHNTKLAKTTSFAGKIEELGKVVFKISQVYRDHRDGFLKRKSLRWHINSITVSLAVTVIALAQYCTDACKVPTPIPIDPIVLDEIETRLDRVQTSLKAFLKSGPAVAHFAD